MRKPKKQDEHRDPEPSSQEYREGDADEALASIRERDRLTAAEANRVADESARAARKEQERVWSLSETARIEAEQQKDAESARKTFRGRLKALLGME